MKTINEIKQEYEKELRRHEKKLSKIENNEIMEKLYSLRFKILDLYYKDYGFPGGHIIDLTTERLQYKFATLKDKEEKKVHASSEWHENFGLFVVVDRLNYQAGWHFAALESNEEYGKLVDEYNSFIDEMRE